MKGLLCCVAMLPLVAAADALTWGEFFAQDFYHMMILPLLAVTVALAIAARPSTTEKYDSDFLWFRVSYLSVWALCVAADWLQGPYVYALYAAYGYSGPEIAQLFVAGFGSSMFFGCFVGSFTDRFGRKTTCILYCLLYIASCMTKHFKDYNMLMVGRVTGGIATSMLFSSFECWMVSEHTRRYNFSGGLLGYMFGLMFTLQYFMAILSGLAGQAAADGFTFEPISEGSVIWKGGYTAPFDLSIICLVLGMTLIILLWDENYGEEDKGSSSKESAGILDNMKMAAGIMMSDSRTLLLGVIVSSFEGSMFAFVFNWTPALASEKTPPPHGVIFALFMMSCMCGSSMSTLISGMVQPPSRLVGIFAAGFGSFVLAAVATAANKEDHLMLSLTAFLVFEFCVGAYFPSIGVLKSEVVPEKVRGTIYNFYRLPLNGIVVGLLLSSITMATCFKLNAFLLLLAFLCMLKITQTPETPKKESRYNPVSIESGVQMREGGPKASQYGQPAE